MISRKNIVRHFILLSLVTPIFSAAEDFRQCYDHAANNHAMIRCAEMEYRHYDRLLNRNYRLLMRTLPEEEQARLREAQRAWIRFRDLECDFEGYEMRGGSGEPLLVLGCKALLTRKRAERLEKLTVTR
jgi:uncharacterized protein YecT (DUF1311 family)